MNSMLVVLFAIFACVKASAILSPFALSHANFINPSYIHGPAAAPYLGHGILGHPSPVLAHAAIAQPPHTPAVFIGADGRPLDTPEVVAARAAHLQAKALTGHYLKKRSLGWGWPGAVSHTSRIDIPTKVVAYHAPVIAHAAPIVAAPIGHGLGLGHGLAPYGWAHGW